MEFCTAVAVVVTGIPLIYSYYTSTGRSTLTAVTLTCDTRDRCYGLRVQLRTLSKDDEQVVKEARIDCHASTCIFNI